MIVGNNSSACSKLILSKPILLAALLAAALMFSSIAAPSSGNARLAKAQTELDNIRAALEMYIHAEKKARSVTKFYTVGDCPVCIGSSELIALKGRNHQKLLFYCPACETAWEHIPTAVDEVYSLAELSPDGLIAPSCEELEVHGVENFQETHLYHELDDIFS